MTSMTVTATPTGATGALLRVLVVTDGTEAGGQKVITAPGPSSESITPKASNSLLVWGINDRNSFTSMTAATNNTLLDNVSIPSGQRLGSGYYTGTVTAGSAATVGVTNVDGSTGYLMNVYEIPSANGSTPSIDGSSPVGVSETTGSSALTTASFDPPAGSVLIALVVGASFPSAWALTDSQSLVWTKQSDNTEGQQVWTATVPTSTLTQVGSTTTGFVHNGTTLSVTKPSGISAGDLILLAGLGFTSGVTSSQPTGFTKVKDATNYGTLYARIADGSEGSSFSFGFGSSGDAVLICEAWRNTGATSATAGWFDPSTFPSWYDPGSAATTIPVPSVTLANANAKLLGFFGAVGVSSQAIVLPPGFTTQAASFGSGTTSGQDIYAAAGRIDAMPSGATGIKTATCKSAVRFGLIVGILPASGGSDTGTGSVAMHKMAVAGTAVETEFGTGSVALKKMGVAGSGTARLHSSGSVALKKMYLAASGSVSAAGAGGAKLKKPALSGAGHVTNKGTGSVHLKKMGVAGSGAEALRGTGSVHLKKMALSGSAVETEFGSGSVRLKKPALSGTAKETETGTGSVHLKKMGLSGSAKETDKGTGSVHLKKLALSGSGAVKLTSTGSVHLKKMGVAGSGQETDKATGSVHLKKMSLSASGTETGAGIGQVQLPKMGLSGSGQETDKGTGSVHLKKFGLSGSAKETELGTGSVSLHKMGLHGSSAGHISGSGSAHLKKMGVAGSGQETDHGTGSVHLKKFTIAGAARGTTSGPLHISMKKMALHGIGRDTGIGSVHLKKMRLEATNVHGHASNLFIFTAV